MRALRMLALLAVAPAALAQVLVSTPRGVVVAHDGRIELVGRWSVEGVANPTFIAASDDRVVVLDALANRATVVALADGETTKFETAETPVAAVFVGEEPYILARDARVLQHGGSRIAVAADAAFLREANGRVYVYSRQGGVLQEVAGDRVTRSITIAPFASDLEISGTTAYLVYPRSGRVRTVELESMTEGGEIAVGAVPVDLTFAGGGTALTARILAVADPSSKRVWLAESVQSMARAVGRGFLRGLLGFGLFSNRSSSFPTGVDRLEIEGTRWIAYDSSTGTLYRFTKKKSSVIATGVAPSAFALTDRGVAWWDGTSVAQTAFDD